MVLTLTLSKHLPILVLVTNPLYYVCLLLNSLVL